MGTPDLGYRQHACVEQLHPTLQVRVRHSFRDHLQQEQAYLKQVLDHVNADEGG